MLTGILCRMPKQTMMIAGGIAIAIVIAIFSYFMFGKSSQSPTGPTEVGTNTQSGESMSKGTIKSLFSGGKNQTCNIKYPEDQQMGQGTVYVSGEKFRGEFTTVAEGKTMDYNMIQDGGYMYSWSSASPQGTKMQISELEKANASPTSGQVDLDSEVDLNCSGWSVDESKFQVPTNITFTDITQTLNQLQSPGTLTKPSSAICDSIADAAAKAACIGQLGN